MLNKYALILAAGLAIVATSFAARAMPVQATLAQLQNEQSDVTAVREGCGRGWHWSFRWQRCVRNW
jgi:hypothetical protein